MSSPLIADFRSDTITQPTPEMRRAMAEAVVGDDSREGDPTARRLEEIAAALPGTRPRCSAPQVPWETSSPC